MSLTITGVLGIILSQILEANVATELAGDIVLVVSIVAAWYGRFRLGDVTVLGLRKKV